MFGINPYELKDEEFAELLSEALWLKHFDQQQMEGTMLKVLHKAFSSKE